MKWWRQFWRLYQIQATLLRYRLDEVVDEGILRWWLKSLRLMQPWLWRRPPGDYGERLRDALVHLGPVFVKFGQLISTRKDLFPDEITNPLQALQDRVPPVDGVDAKSALAEIFGQPVEALFAEFDTTPLASASVAQVHAAKLPNGEAVVIKWLRPGIERIVALDVALMKSVSQFLHRRLPKIRRFRLPEVVADYRRTILDELDLRREAANQAQLHRNFADSEDLYIPKVYWDYCHRRAMVSERIYGLGVGDIEKLRAAGVNMQRLAEKGVSVFFTQVFRDNFFHADMHPGNIFVDATHPDNPKYIGVDCAIVGSLDARDQRYLAENFVAFFNRDYRRVAQLHVESGWVNPNTSVNEFEAAIRTVCEPIFGRPLAQISFGKFLMHLFQVAQRFDMEVQPQLVLLQKTLLYVEGLGRQLYPELDLWKTAKPFLENWLADRMSPKRVLQTIRQEWPYWREQLPSLPENIWHALTAINTLPEQLAHTQKALEKWRMGAQLRSRAWWHGALAFATGTLSLAVLSGPWLWLGGAVSLVFMIKAGWLLSSAGRL